jgi:type I restriction enzyme S subunit
MRKAMQDRNANRPGYKKTKAGWIPEDWNCVSLEEVAYVQTGLAKNKKNDLQNPIECPYLRVANVQDNYLDLREIKTIKVESSNIERYLLKYGDVLFTEGGDFDKLGRGTIWRNELERCLHQNYIFVVRCKTEYLNRNYLAALSSSQIGRRYFILSSKQSTNLASINSTQLKEFPLPLPNLSEQNKIAEVLNTWDTIIDQTQKFITVKKNQKKALMQYLLTGKKRLPGYTNPWKEYCLGDLFSERRETNGDHLLLLAITGKKGVVPSSDIDRKDSSSADKSRYKRIFPGDIGYNTMRMWQGVSAVSELEGIVSPAYTICKPKKDINSYFFGYLFKLPSVVHLFWRHSQGLVSDTLNLKFHNFAQIKIKVPEIKEQDAIAKTMSAIDDDIWFQEKKLATMEKQKRGLMQKLLTGEIRVKT